MHFIFLVRLLTAISAVGDDHMMRGCAYLGVAIATSTHQQVTWRDTHNANSIHNNHEYSNRLGSQEIKKKLRQRNRDGIFKNSQHGSPISCDKLNNVKRRCSRISVPGGRKVSVWHAISDGRTREACEIPAVTLHSSITTEHSLVAPSISELINQSTRPVVNQWLSPDICCHISSSV